MEFFESDNQGNILREGYFYEALGNVLSYKLSDGRLTNRDVNYQVKELTKDKCVPLIEGVEHTLIPWLKYNSGE